MKCFTPTIMVMGSTLYAITGEKHSPISPRYELMTYSSYHLTRYVSFYNGTDIMGVTNYFSIGFKACSIRWSPT